MTTFAGSAPDLVAARDSLRLVFDPKGADLQAAIDCETDVFRDRFGETRDHLDQSFTGYEQATAFLALIDGTGVAVASSRLIIPNPAGLKTTEYVAGNPWRVDGEVAMRNVGLNLASTWDVATLSVRPRSRATGALWTAALCHGLFQVARANGVTGTVALMDEVARELLAGVGIIYTTLPGTFTAPFDGSPGSTPVFADMQAMIDDQRRRFPDAHRLISLGVGLGGISLPAFSDYRLKRRSIDVRFGAAIPQPTERVSATLAS